ncbi:Ig-like domain-containing protein [Persicobacter psychrovividus]
MMYKTYFLMVWLIAIALPVRAQWEDLNPGGGGQIQDVICDPNIEGRLYLSSDMEGVYRSDDYGASWHIKSDDLVHTRAFVTTVDPTNSNRIYVGTLYGLSISDNAGDQYHFATSTADNSINAIAIDPFDASHIIAGVGWKDDYDFWTWGIGRVASKGLGYYFESKDYGSSWQKVTYTTIDDEYFNIYAIRFDQKRPGTFYIGGDQGLWKTIDGGANWALIPGPTTFKCRGIDLTPDGNTIYATYATDNGDYFNVGSGSKIFATRTANIQWTDISAGLQYTSQMWYPEVDVRSDGDFHKILVGFRNQRTGVWEGSIQWNDNSISSHSWANILKERDNFDPGWDTWYPNPNVRWAHYTPLSWSNRGIWATGNQTLFYGEEQAGEWQFLNKYCQPSSIITPSTGEPTYHNRGFASTFTFDGTAIENYAIQSQGDNGIQESWDYGYSWNNHEVREYSNHNHADAVDIAEVDGVPTVVVAAAKGWGGVNLNSHTILTKQLHTFSPSDQWQSRNGNLPTNYNVKELRVSPHNKKSVVMGIYGSGIWWIEDIKDFINGGNAVQIADKVTDHIAGANSIAFHPTNPNILYLASNIFTNDPNTNEKQVLWKGERQSGNQWEWSIIHDAIGWGATVAATQIDGQLYLLHAAQTKTASGYTTDQQLSISADEGASWQTILNKETTLPLAQHSWYDYIANRYEFRYGGLAVKDNQIFVAAYHHEFGKPYGMFRGIIEPDKTISWENWTADHDWPGMNGAQIREIEGKTYYYGSTSGAGLWRREITPVDYGGITAPDGLLAENVASGIQLSWQDNSNNETGFQIERGNGGAGFATLTTVDANTTSFIDDGFCPGRAFSYRVRAINATTKSSPSNTATATSASPVLPTGNGDGLVVQYFNDINLENPVAVDIVSPIVFNWQRTAPNTCMNVDFWSARFEGEITAETSGTYQIQATADDAVAVWVEGQLLMQQNLEDPNDPVSGTLQMTAGQAYRIRIEYQEEGWDAHLKMEWAKDGGAFTTIPAAAFSSYTVGPMDPPATPADVSAEAISASAIQINWTDLSDNEEQFIIEQNSGQDWQVTGTATANATTFVAQDLVPQTDYTFRVQAKNNGGRSGWSNTATATTNSLPTTLPEAPTDLQVSTNGTEVNLLWSDQSDNELWFIIERKQNQWEAIDSVAANLTNYIDRSAEAVSNYEYRVVAKNNVGISGSSNSAMVRIPDAPQQGIIGARKTLSTMQVDGQLTENVWDLYASASKNITGASDNKVTFATLWDDQYLYVAIKVEDANLWNDSAEDYNDDATEVYIDGGFERSSSYDQNDRQFTKGYQSDGLSGSTNNAGVMVAWAQVADGYTVEYAIPWSNIGQSAYNSKKIGFDIAVNDDDDGGPRDAQLMWMGTDNNWSNTSQFGTLVLSDETVSGGDQPWPPVVEISAPTTGSRSNVGEDVLITASASDPDGNISKVAFYAGDLKIGEDYTAPYSVTYPAPAVGLHYLSAVATDQDGYSTLSEVVTIEVVEPTACDAPNLLPNGHFESGTGGWNFYTNSGNGVVANFSSSNVGAIAGAQSAKIQIDQNGSQDSDVQCFTNLSLAAGIDYEISYQAKASSSTNIRVQLLQEGSWVDYGQHTVSLSPQIGTYTLQVNLANADQNARLDFFLGNTASTIYLDEISVREKCTNVPTDPVPPVVHISSPSAGDTFTSGESVWLTAEASDADGFVSSVRFFADDVLIGEDDSSPFSIQWQNLSAGTYQLTAQAVDDDQQTTLSGAVQIQVENPNLPPTVSLTAPLDGSIFLSDEAVLITAEASDPDGTISAVELYLDGSLLETLNSAPYQWEINDLSVGNYTLQVTATDQQGMTASSETIEISVENSSVCDFPNLVGNGDFGNGANGWQFYTNGGSGTSAQLQTNGEAYVNIDQGGNMDSDIQLYTQLNLLANVTYEVTFSAKAQSDRNMRVQVLQEGSWANYGQTTVALTPNFVSYQFEFSISSPDGNARLDFFLGQANADVTIGQVTVQEKCEAQNQRVMPENTIQIYPNPIFRQQALFIAPAGAKVKSVEIFTVGGALIYQTNFSQQATTPLEIPSGSFEQTGLYLIRLQTDQGQQLKKIMVY